MSAFLCTSESLHPYECPGMGKCRHCDRRIIVSTGDEGTSYYEHHPADCALCEAEYDHGPGLPPTEEREPSAP